MAPFFLHYGNLGDYSYISKNSSISHCSIGKFCSIGPNFCCGMGIHPTDGFSTSPMFYSMAKQNGLSLSKDNKIEEFKQTKIGNDVFIGANVTLLDGGTSGDGAVIGAGAVVSNNVNICGGCTVGAGAVVIRDIDEPGTYVGVPAMAILKEKLYE